MEPIRKSDKLANVCYDIRGPVLQKAKQMEDEGHKIIKLNIGNLAPFGFVLRDSRKRWHGSGELGRRSPKR